MTPVKIDSCHVDNCYRILIKMPGIESLWNQICSTLKQCIVFEIQVCGEKLTGHKLLRDINRLYRIPHPYKIFTYRWQGRLIETRQS